MKTNKSHKWFKFRNRLDQAFRELGGFVNQIKGKLYKMMSYSEKKSAENEYLQTHDGICQAQ